MKFNRRDLNKVLAVMERGAFIVAGAAMIFGITLRTPAPKKTQPVRTPKKNYIIVKNPVFPATRQDSTFFYTDTIRVNGDEYAARKSWGHGAYNRYKNTARLNIIVDMSDNTSDTATQFINNFNATKTETAYHEVRHALNLHWMGRAQRVDSIMLTADEYWARVAGKSAMHVGMPDMKTGWVALNINYSVPTAHPLILTQHAYDPHEKTFRIRYGAIGVDRATQEMADAAIGGAIDDLSQRFNLYASSQFHITDSFAEKIEQSRQQNRDRCIKYHTAMDSMAMFKINGRMLYLPAMASPDTRARLDTFFTKFVPAQLEKHYSSR